MNNDEWSQAEMLMSNYKNILERRDELNTQLMTMERQNIQLENELAEKLQDEKNNELTFPPSTVVSIARDSCSF